MIQHVSPLHLRQKFGDVLNRVALRQDEYVIESKGQPLLEFRERLDNVPPAD